MSEETKAIIDILETYWKKGGFYEIPTEIINDVKGELEDKDKEIEKLNKQIEEYQKALDETTSEKIDLENIIKEVREYIESFNLPKDLGVLGEAPISISELKHILEILDKLDKEDK